jgi:hypothetical protein
MINKIDAITSNVRIRRVVYIVLGLMTLAMVLLSVVQVWVLWSVDSIPAYGSIEANTQGYPPDDQRGAFLMLNDPHNPAYPGDLLALLATTDPGVVDEQSGAHLISSEVKAILIQTVALNEMTDYRVYRLADAAEGEMKYDPQPGGHDLLISPISGEWKVGHYIVDIPVEGMDAGRTYFEFYVDQEEGK